MAGRLKQGLGSLRIRRGEDDEGDDDVNSSEVDGAGGEPRAAVDLEAPDLILRDEARWVRLPKDDQAYDDFVLEQSSKIKPKQVDSSDEEDERNALEVLSKEMDEKTSGRSTWRRQAWSTLEPQILGQQTQQQGQEPPISMQHFKGDSLDLRRNDPTVEIVVRTLKEHVQSDLPSRLVVYRILMYAVEAFYSNLYKDGDTNIMEHVKELSDTIVRVAIRFGARGGPIRRETLSLAQSTTIYSGEETVNTVLGKLSEYISLKDPTLKTNNEHADSLTISMAMFTALLLRCRVKHEKIAKAVRLMLKKAEWPNLKNEACYCAAELVRSHLGGIADEETIEKAIETVLDISTHAENSSGVAYLAAVFAPLIKPSPYAAMFRAEVVRLLADSFEPNEQKLYGLAVARVGRAKAEVAWEQYLSRATVVDAQKNANQSRTIFVDEDDGIYNYESIVINLDDDDKEIHEEDEVPPPPDELAASTAGVTPMDDDEAESEMGRPSISASEHSMGTETTRDSEGRISGRSEASSASAGSFMRRPNSKRSSQRRRKVLSGKGIGKNDLRKSMSLKSIKGEGSVRSQSKLFRRSETSRRESSMQLLQNDIELGEQPMVNFDAFAETVQMLVKAGLYTNVEGVTWATAASVQAWRTKEFAHVILPLVVAVLNDKSDELGGILPAVSEGVTIGLTRGVPTSVLLQVMESIHDFLKLEDHPDTDVSDGVSLQIASACLREVSGDVVKVGVILDKLVSLSLGILGTVSMFSRSAGAEFLSLVGSAVPIKRERIVEKVVERLRVALIGLQSDLEDDGGMFPTGMYTVMGCSKALVGLVDGAKDSLGLPYDVLERTGELAFTLVSGLRIFAETKQEVVGSICRRCGWAILGSMLRYNLPQFFTPQRIGTLVTLWRAEFGDSTARSELSRYRKSAAQEGQLASRTVRPEDEKTTQSFTRQPSKLSLTSTTNLQISMDKPVAASSSRASSSSRNSRASASRSSRTSSALRYSRPSSIRNSSRSSGRRSSASQYYRSSSRSRASSRRSGRRSTGLSSVSAGISSLFGGSQSNRPKKRENAVPDEELMGLFEESFDLLRIEKRLERVDKDPGFSGYTTSRTGIVKVGAVADVKATTSDHRSTARAAAMAALYQILGVDTPGITEEQKATLIGAAACYVTQLLNNDIDRKVEKYVWSLEVWWILRAVSVHPVLNRAGDACFQLAVDVAVGMQYSVVDDSAIKLRSDPLKRPLYEQLLPLLHVNAFNTPETVTTAAETLTISTNALAALASRDGRYGIALLETISTNLSSFTATLASYACLSLTTAMDRNNLARQGNLLAHIQGLLQKTASATASSFEIHASDIYDRGGDNFAILNTSSFAVVAAAYHELGQKCGEDFLIGLLQNAFGLYEKMPEAHVATMYLMGKLLQGSEYSESELALKAAEQVESVLVGFDHKARVAAALSLGPQGNSRIVAERADSELRALVSAMAEEKGEREWNFSSNLYAPESQLGAARAVIGNCGDVAAYGLGAEGVINSCLMHGEQLSPPLSKIAEEIALELISWDLLPSPVTRATGLGLLSVRWKAAILSVDGVQKKDLYMSELWSSFSNARKIGWAIYESLICPPEENFSMVREAAIDALNSLIRAVGAAKVSQSFEDLPEMLFAAVDYGCMSAVPILLALVRADATRRFGFWVDLTKNIASGGPKMQTIAGNSRWDSNINRIGVKVVTGKLMQDADKGLYGAEWDAGPVTRGLAVYILRMAVEVAERSEEQLTKKKLKGSSRERTLLACLRDILFFALDSISGADRNIVTITQGLTVLDKVIKLGIDRKSFADEFPSGRLSKVLRKLLKSNMHPDVVTKAIAATGSILTTTADTELFEDGLAKAFFTRDLPGIHLSFQYDSIAETFSSSATMGSLQSYAEVIYRTISERRDQFLKKLKSKVSVFYRLFGGICGDYASVVFDGGKSLSVLGSTVVSVAFEPSCTTLFDQYVPRMLFTTLSIHGNKAVSFDTKTVLGESVEWFNLNAPGVHLSRAESPLPVLLSLAVWWLRNRLPQEGKSATDTRYFKLCLNASKTAVTRDKLNVPVELYEELMAAISLHDEEAGKIVEEEKKEEGEGKVEEKEEKKEKGEEKQGEASQDAAPKVEEKVPVKRAIAPPRAEFLTAVKTMSASSSQSSVTQATKYLLGVLRPFAEGYSTVTLVRYGNAVLHGVFELLVGSNASARAAVADDLVELVTICFKLNREVGRDLDDLVAARAALAAGNYADAGDVAGFKLSMSIGWCAYEASVGGPRETKCLERILDAADRAMESGRESVIVVVLGDERLLGLALDALVSPNKDTSLRYVGSLWSSIMVLALRGRGQVGSKCRELLNTAIERSVEVPLASRSEGLSSVMLCMFRHSAAIREKVVPLVGEQAVLDDVEEVMNPEYVAPEPQQEDEDDDVNGYDRGTAEDYGQYLTDVTATDTDGEVTDNADA